MDPLTEEVVMDPDRLEKLEAAEDHLRELVRRHQQFHEVQPYVHKTLELLEWEREALASQPTGSGGMSPFWHDPDDSLYDSIPRDLPMPPLYDLERVRASTSGVLSGTASWYGHFAWAATSEAVDPEIRAHALEHVRSYGVLQEKQRRSDEVRSLLQKLGSPRVLEQLENSVRRHYDYLGDTSHRGAAASQMRLLLDGLKGELFDRSGIKDEAKAKRERWVKMADTLAVDAPGGTAHQTLVKEWDRRHLLYMQLTDIMKDRGGAAAHDLEMVWKQVLDHISITLGVVRI